MGIELFLSDEGKLKARGMHGVINAEVKALVSSNKAELVAYLKKMQEFKAKERVVIGRAKDRTQLSFAQQRLWIIDQLQSGSAEYNMPMAFEVSGELDISMVKRVLETIIERHEVLRSNYIDVDGIAKQVVHPISEVDFGIEIEVADGKGSELIAEMVKAEFIKPFDLAADLMIRVKYIRTGSHAGVLLFNMHHIASDGWSMEVLSKEFFALYDAFGKGLGNPLPELDIQYADFAQWQHKYLSGEVLNKQLKYWESQLEEAPPVHGLPLSFARPDVKNHVGAIVSKTLSIEVTEQLNLVAKKFNLTLFMLMHGALSLVLSKHSNSTDIVIGTPIANRLQQEIAPMIGFFTNTLALRADTNHATLAEYFRHIKQVNLDAQSHQDVPFEQLVDRLKVERSAAHTPLFQIVMTMQENYGVDHDRSAGSIALPGASLSPYHSDTIAAKFDLTADFAFGAQGAEVTLTYDTSLFSAEKMQRLSEHLCRLLEALSGISDTMTAPYNLPMLSSGEQDHLINVLGETKGNFTTDLCIHELFEQQVVANPDNTALIYDSEHVTYKELNDKSNQIAHYLRDNYSIQPDTLIGLCVGRSLEMVVGLLGILKAGGAYVPLDPSYPVDRLRHMLDDSGLDLMLTQGEVDHVTTVFDGQVIALDSITDKQCTQNIFSTYSTEDLNKAEIGLHSASLAYVIYTSGSTGKPKGVLQTHENVTRLFLSTNSDFQFTQDDCWCLFHSISFDFSVWELWGALAYGGRLLILGKDDVRDVAKLTQLYQSHGLTVLNQTPSSFKNFIAYTQAQNTHVDSLRYVIFGGEALATHHVENWFTRNESAARVSLINMYGITETTVHVTLGAVTASNYRNINIGKPLQDQCIYILDEHGTLVPHGAVGEAYVAGNGLARGYLNRPELTVERFIQNPFFNENKENDSERLYRTGDLVRYNSANELEYIGRADHQVKIRGFRIEIGEIEHQLGELECVDSALVMAKDIAGSDQLVAYIKANVDVSDDEMEAFISGVKMQLGMHLPDYMVPSLFAKVASWPLTPNGKVDRKALPDHMGASVSEYKAAETETQHYLVNIWASLLALDVSAVSVNSNFFTIGGNSLLAMRMITEVKTQLRKDLSVQVLFSGPTIEAISNTLDQDTIVSDHPAIVPVERSDEGHELSFSQQRLWFIDDLQGGSPEYNIPAAFKVCGKLNLDKMQRAVSEIIRRHEVLRTTYHKHEGHAVQRVKAISDFNFEIKTHDIATILPAEKAEYEEQLIREVLQYTFDLSSDLMLKVDYIQSTDESGVLLFNMHHIASDGWSMEVLSKEFFTLYSQDETEVEPALPILDVQYLDYAKWQRDHVQVSDQLAYWRSQLDDVPLVHSLPLSKPRPTNKQYMGQTVSSVLSAEVAEGLRQLARKFDITPFMLMHGALSLVLSNHSNNTDIVVGTPVANRMQSQLSSLIGFFVNTVVLRANTDHATLAQYFAHIKSVNLEAQGNQEVPFEQIVEVLNIPRTNTHTPLFQIMLTTDTDYGVSQNDKRHSIELSGAELLPLRLSESPAKFDLDVHLSMNDDGVELNWTYDISIFDEDYIAQLDAHLCKLLANMTAYIDSENVPMQQVSILTQSEVKHLVAELNDTQVVYPSELCIHELFEQQVVRNPKNTALNFAGIDLNYEEVNEKANQVAHYLLNEHKLLPGTLVGLCVERSLEMVIGILGVLKAGAAYVPIDPTYPQGRIEHMLKDSGLTLVLGQSSTTDLLRDFTGEVVQLDGLSTNSMPLNPALANSCTNNVERAISGVAPKSLAYVIYTSGSTGKPKGVACHHNGAVNMAFNQRKSYQVTDNSVVLQYVSMSFDAMVWDWVMALSVGAKLVIVSQEARLDSHKLEALVLEQQVTHATFPPAALQILPFREDYNFKNMILAGESCSIEVASLWSCYSLNNAYGPTETSVCATTGPMLIENVRCIGKAIDNVKLLVLSKQGNLVPKGHVGELYIGGDGVTHGYLNRSELTNETFVNLSGVEGVSQDEVFYRTGDLVKYLASGDLEFIGRVGSQVKLRGYRIDLHEIEHVINGLPQVVDSLVMKVSEGRQDRLVSYIKKCLTCEMDDEKLSEYIKRKLKQDLPDYMVPTGLAIVDAWPLTPNGKVDKASLPAITLGSELRIEEPETSTEVRLQNIWHELLSLPIERICVNSSFFELGGHSMLLSALQREISEVFSVQIELSVIFSDPSIRAISLNIDTALNLDKVLEGIPSEFKESNSDDIEIVL